MAKFYIFIDRGCDYAPIIGECATSEEAEAFLLENKEVDSDPDSCWIIHGKRFGFQAQRIPVGFMLTGPSEVAVEPLRPGNKYGPTGEP